MLMMSMIVVMIVPGWVVPKILIFPMLSVMEISLQLFISSQHVKVCSAAMLGVRTSHENEIYMRMKFFGAFLYS